MDALRQEGPLGVLLVDRWVDRWVDRLVDRLVGLMADRLVSQKEGLMAGRSVDRMVDPLEDLCSVDPLEDLCLEAQTESGEAVVSLQSLALQLKPIQRLLAVQRRAQELH
jgi:hypothetical protein